MVEPTEDPNIFFVKSESNPLGGYRVDLAAKTCTCPDSGRGNVCKHRCAAWLYRENHAQEEPQPDPQPDPDPEEEKRPYVRLAGELFPVEIHYIITATNGAKFARLRSFRPQDWYPMIITLPVESIFYR